MTAQLGTSDLIELALERADKLRAGISSLDATVDGSYEGVVYLAALAGATHATLRAILDLGDVDEHRDAGGDHQRPVVTGAVGEADPSPRPPALRLNLAGNGRDNGVIDVECLDGSVVQHSHNLAPSSLAGTESVGPPAACPRDHAAGDDRTGGVV